MDIKQLVWSTRATTTPLYANPYATQILARGVYSAYVRDELAALDASEASNVVACITNVDVMVHNCVKEVPGSLDTVDEDLIISENRTILRLLTAALLTGMELLYRDASMTLRCLHLTIDDELANLHISLDTGNILELPIAQISSCRVNIRMVDGSLMNEREYTDFMDHQTDFDLPKMKRFVTSIYWKNGSSLNLVYTDLIEALRFSFYLIMIRDGIEHRSKSITSLRCSRPFICSYIAENIGKSSADIGPLSKHKECPVALAPLKPRGAGELYYGLFTIEEMRWIQNRNVTTVHKSIASYVPPHVHKLLGLERIEQNNKDSGICWSSSWKEVDRESDHSALTRQAEEAGSSNSTQVYTNYTTDDTDVVINNMSTAHDELNLLSQNACNGDTSIDEVQYMQVGSSASAADLNDISEEGSSEYSALLSDPQPSTYNIRDLEDWSDSDPATPKIDLEVIRRKLISVDAERYISTDRTHIYTDRTSKNIYIDRNPNMKKTVRDRVPDNTTSNVHNTRNNKGEMNACEPIISSRHTDLDDLGLSSYGSKKRVTDVVCSKRDIMAGKAEAEQKQICRFMGLTCITASRETLPKPRLVPVVRRVVVNSDSSDRVDDDEAITNRYIKTLDL